MLNYTPGIAHYSAVVNPHKKLYRSICQQILTAEKTAGVFRAFILTSDLVHVRYGILCRHVVCAMILCATKVCLDLFFVHPAFYEQIVSPLQVLVVILVNNEFCQLCLIHSGHSNHLCGRPGRMASQLQPLSFLTLWNMFY